MNGEGDHDVSGYVQNPIFIGGDEENQTDNNIGAIAVDNDQAGGRTKRNHRHSPEQIQELENFYKECPFPNENQRLELGQRLNLETSQIKYWFQNRRTHARTQQERHNNIILTEENEKLRRDQEWLKQEMILFPEAGKLLAEFAELGCEARQLLAHNARLVQEMNHLDSQIPLETQPPTLQRHCESLWTLSSTNLALLYPGLSAKAATEMVKLGQRMTLSYYSSITGSSMYKWDIIQSVAQNMTLMTRMVNEDVLGEHTGTVLSASTSIWLPVNHNIIFYFLSHKSFRHQWDILTYKTSMEDIIQIDKAKSYTNYVSLLKIIGNGMQILQEVWNDASGSMLVYAPVDDSSMEEVMRGENSDSVKLLPSGFSILPDGGPYDTSGGSLLTVGFQFLVGTKPTTEITQDTVRVVEDLMVRTIDKIKFALQIQM